MSIDQMNAIYQALRNGLSAAEALLTWQERPDGRDMVNGRIREINKGMEAYDAISRNLRDGRQHIHHEELPSRDEPKAANLETPDEGHVLCEMCDGVGVTMVAYLLPTGHTERDVKCEECGGSGQIEK